MKASNQWSLDGQVRVARGWTVTWKGMGAKAVLSRVVRVLTRLDAGVAREAEAGNRVAMVLQGLRLMFARR